MNNPVVQKLGNTIFNLLMVDNWLICIFRTNNDLWSLLQFLGEKLAAGEPVPKEIYVFTLVGINSNIYDISVVETGRIVRMPINLPSEDEPKDRFVYTAVHEHIETERLKELVREAWPQIMEVLLHD